MSEQVIASAELRYKQWMNKTLRSRQRHNYLRMLNRLAGGFSLLCGWVYERVAAAAVAGLQWFVLEVSSQNYLCVLLNCFKVATRISIT